MYERVIERVIVDENGCWVFTGPRNEKGYGRIGKRKVRTHRIVYEHFNGPIEEGMEIDHLCFNTSCCNPDHLEQVTRAENLQRRQERPTCRKGHPLTESNVYVDPGDGGRRCKICRRERYTRYNRKRAA